MPKTNVIGSNGQPITGGMNLNDFDIGRTNLNDLSGVQNVDRSLTSNQIDEFGDNRDLVSEFGDNRNINMDEFATQNNIDNRLMQEYLTDQASFQQPITASQIDEFGDNRDINMNEFAGNDIQMQNYLTDQANYNADPFGNPNMDPRVVSEEYGLVGNNTLPGNDIVAGNYSQNAVGKQLYGQEYDVLTPFEQQQIDKAIDTIGTRSNGQLARNGGIMGYGRG